MGTIFCVNWSTLDKFDSDILTFWSEGEYFSDSSLCMQDNSSTAGLLTVHYLHFIPHDKAPSEHMFYVRCQLSDVN